MAAPNSPEEKLEKLVRSLGMTGRLAGFWWFLPGKNRFCPKKNAKFHCLYLCENPDFPKKAEINRHCNSGGILGDEPGNTPFLGKAMLQDRTEVGSNPVQWTDLNKLEHAGTHLVTSKIRHSILFQPNFNLPPLISCLMSRGVQDFSNLEFNPPVLKKCWC